MIHDEDNNDANACNFNEKDNGITCVAITLAYPNFGLENEGKSMCVLSVLSTRFSVHSGSLINDTETICITSIVSCVTPMISCVYAHRR